MTERPPSHARQEIGTVLPDFSLPGINGATGSLERHLSGKRAAVVVFWSGMCSHCRRYDEYLNQLPTVHHGVALVAVASRQGETADQIRASVNDRGLHFPILHDSDGAVAKQWFVQQTPRVFLMDSKRALLYRGAVDNFKYPDEPDYQPYLEQAIEAFLAGQPVPRPETASFGCPIRTVYYNLPKPL